MALTRIQSIGIATGISLTGVTTTQDAKIGTGITLSPDGDVYSTGIITATSYRGDVSNCTGVGQTNFIDAETINVSGITSVGAGITLSPDGDVFFTGIITGNGSGLSNVGVDTGVVFTDKLSLGDNEYINVGLASDLKIFHNGTDSLIDSDTGKLKIDSVGGLELYGTYLNVYKAGGSETIAEFAQDGACNLYYNNAKRFETTAAGTLLADGVKAQFGTGADCDIYHSGSHMVIENDVGNTYIYGNRGAGEQGVTINRDGTVDLFHNGVKTLNTTSTGIEVRGPESGNCELYMYADEGDDNSDLWKFVAFHSPTGALDLYNKTSGSWEKSIGCIGDGATSLWHDNSLKIETTSTGAHVTSGANATSKLHIGHQATRGLDIRIANTGGQVDSTAILDAKDAESSNYHAQIQFHLGASEKARFDGNGNYFRLASGTAGMQFGGDSAAANALDDYEEGTFTPVNQSGSGVSDAWAGKYTKIGNRCMFTIQQTAGTYGFSAMQSIRGLPFVNQQNTAGAVTNGNPNISGTCLIYSDSNMNIYFGFAASGQSAVMISGVYQTA